MCSWPRATIQGALSKIPGNLALFAPAVNSEILYAGIFTLAVCAPLGAVALDLLGGALLRKIKAMEDQIQVYLPLTTMGLINEHSTNDPLLQASFRVHVKDQTILEFGSSLCAIFALVLVFLKSNGLLSCSTPDYPTPFV